ncbi:MAG TPA: hypothetical protein VEU62_08765, partial [Bryobacterales bacterium]|nr:hypothetical protein [Bryobacterales bacterium]
YLARHPAPEIGLDVFARNRSATAWYRRLGFEQRTRLGWWISVRGVRAATARPPAAVAAAAARQHRAWGFSQLAARTGAGRYQVGRLYAPFFRLTDPRAAADPDLLAALARLNPRRRLLLIAPASSAWPGRRPGWEQVAQSRRLRARSAVLLSRLAAARQARRVTAPAILELENPEREKARHLL